MFKFGVYSVEQLLKGQTKTFFGAHKNVSVTLLDKIRDQSINSDAFSSIMLSLNDGRGAYKRTYHSRFEEFDARCSEILRGRYSEPSLRIHDVAISSGETAVDFFKRLEGDYPALSYLATDYDPYLTIIYQRSLAISITSDESLVEITMPPFVLTPKRPDRAFYPVNRLLCKIVTDTFAKRLLFRHRKGTLPSKDVRRINLFCPQARKLAGQDARFKLGQHNILSSSNSNYDCIRAMNVLNESYFSKSDFQKVLSNLHDSLVGNGLLIVGSNNDPGTAVSGAVYSKIDYGFELEWSTANRPTVSKHIDIYNSQKR